MGKTTLMRKLHEALKDFHPVGFCTAEIRQEGIRKGFELVDLKGKGGVLSHIDFKGGERVGRYKVDVDGFGDLFDGISFFDPSSAVIMIDEIGKMECLSNKFNRILEEILDSEKWVIATIALKGSGRITEIKQRQDVKLFEITPGNRDVLLSEVLKEINLKNPPFRVGDE